MISMRYDLAHLSIPSLLRPISDVGIAVARLDERIARSGVGSGWTERSHFGDASLWIDGELAPSMTWCCTTPATTSEPRP